MQKTIGSPDDGLSEYLVQYTHAGHRSGCDSGVGAAPPLPPFTAEEVFSANFGVLPPELSSALAVLFLGLGDNARDELEDDVLSLLQLESWHGVPG